MNSTDLLDDICVIYSRSIGGPGQTVEIRPGIITSPESADYLVDLMYSAEESVHAEIRDLAEHWGEYRVGAPFRQYWLPKWRALLDAAREMEEERQDLESEADEAHPSLTAAERNPGLTQDYAR
jgi:hypothetical protein